MRKTFKVHKVTKTIYLPRDVRQEGFDVELDGYMNAVTLTLIRPGTRLDHAIESLQGVIRDFELRKKAGMERTPVISDEVTENIHEKPKIEESIPQENDFDKMRRKLEEGRKLKGSE